MAKGFDNAAQAKTAMRLSDKAGLTDKQKDKVKAKAQGITSRTQNATAAAKASIVKIGAQDMTAAAKASLSKGYSDDEND